MKVIELIIQGKTLTRRCHVKITCENDDPISIKQTVDAALSEIEDDIAVYHRKLMLRDFTKFNYNDKGTTKLYINPQGKLEGQEQEEFDLFM